MVRRPELSLCTAIPSGHHEHDSPPSTQVILAPSGTRIGHAYMHIHWGLLDNGSNSPAPLVDKRNIRAVVLLRCPGSLTLTFERG